MAKEDTGQAAEQPNLEQMAQSVALGILTTEENPPEETAAQETQAEETEQEQEQQQEPAVDWDKIKGVKRKLTVKGDDGSDQEVELSLEEMEKGVMLERSYRQKTAQLARERESVQTKTKEAIDAKVKEYDDKLALAEQAIWHTLAPEIQSIDWNKLATENPAEWARQYQYVQNVNAKLAQVQSERKKISDSRSKEQQEATKKHAAQSWDVLSSEIPGWNGDLYGKVLKTGIEYGFGQDEVNAITDHRALKVLHDAMQYRALKAKPPADKKVVTTPKVAKPGSAEKPDPNADQWNEGMAKLRKTGKAQDAHSLAKQILAREGIK